MNVVRYLLFSFLVVILGGCNFADSDSSSSSPGATGSASGSSGNGGDGGGGDEGEGSTGEENGGEGSGEEEDPIDPETRPGISYSVYIDVEETGDTVAFTVHEPTQVTEGEKYPLILYGHGGGESRVADSEDPAIAYSPLNNPKIYRDAGYGVISMDQRGHGESSGTIRLMDPEYEGLNLLAILDWAELYLDWLDFGPSADGTDPHNMKLGAIGGSYGGAFQMLIHHIDPKRRLDAIIPETTWHDVNYSIAPNETIKTLWNTFLTLRLSTASNQVDPSKIDPFVRDMQLEAMTTNRFSQEQKDFLYYHSPAYFCNGEPVSTLAGTEHGPRFAPIKPHRINALFMQGMRDTLFNLNEAWLNYQCFREAGGDVRLMTYHYGHNATPVVPDPGVRPTQPGPDTRTPPFDSFSNVCEPLSGHEAGLAFMDEFVKGIPGAADIVPEKICLSLTAEDAVLVDQITEGTDGTQADLPETYVMSGVSDQPVPVDLGLVAGEAGDVVAGIPHIQLEVTSLAEGAPGAPVVFIGVGVMRATSPGYWELADNQVTPVKGTGDFDLPLVGVGERLNSGDRVGLLIYGSNYQYALGGSVNAAEPTAIPVTLAGRVWIPLLGE